MSISLCRLYFSGGNRLTPPLVRNFLVPCSPWRSNLIVAKAVGNHSGGDHDPLSLYYRTER